MMQATIKRLSFLVVFIGIFIYVLPGSVAQALEPGCYVSTAANGKTRTTCPDENRQRSVDTLNKCFVAIVGSNGPGRFNEVDCSTGAVSNANSSTETKIPEGDPINTDCNSEQLHAPNGTEGDCGIIGLLVNGINFLTALAGMAIIASIIFAGYQYMIAQDNSGQIQAARTRIIWSIVALLMLIFTYAFLNWVVPGGVL